MKESELCPLGPCFKDLIAKSCRALDLMKKIILLMFGGTEFRFCLSCKIPLIHDRDGTQSSRFMLSDSVLIISCLIFSILTKKEAWKFGYLSRNKYFCTRNQEIKNFFFKFSTHKYLLLSSYYLLPITYFLPPFYRLSAGTDFFVTCLWYSYDTQGKI